MTLDEMIEELQKQKAAGVPGNTVVALQGQDNNGRGGFANFEVNVRMGAVAKAEFEKNWTIAKFVSSRGVPVLVLG
ncbi:hypothetical protein WL29_22650 [Burkholderia ubonensis]|uniref:Uncharacterized protein n=1 Tax=Burkholderia ubonensis TaxID=101571 RepID=A0A125DME9_9BURK|nr:hypothetical protein WL29_22650 [Burkholderia ubonensis]